MYRYRSCTRSRCVVPAHYTHSVIRCRPIRAGCGDPYEPHRDCLAPRLPRCRQRRRRRLATSWTSSRRIAREQGRDISCGREVLHNMFCMATTALDESAGSPGRFSLQWDTQQNDFLSPHLCLTPSQWTAAVGGVGSRAPAMSLVIPSTRPPLRLGLRNRRLFGWSTRVNRNTIVYQYLSCTRSRCIVDCTSALTTLFSYTGSTNRESRLRRSPYLR